jgi:gliding motility-associated-like protein
MSTRPCIQVFFIGLLLCTWLVPVGAAMAHGGAHEAAPPSSAVSFIPNAGQWDPQILYMAYLRGGQAWLTHTGISLLYYETDSLEYIHDLPRYSEEVVTFGAHLLKLKWLDAPGASSIEGSAPRPGAFNYFVGNDPAKWASGLALVGTVRYRNLYPGIDLEVTGSASGGLKYNLIAQPGADLDEARFVYEGADKVELIHNTLHIHTSIGVLQEQMPAAWLGSGHGQRPAQVQYTLNRSGALGYAHAGRRTEALTIDPVLVFSTYSGSNADNWGMTATFDEAGNAYSGGVVHNFAPTTGLLSPGAYQVAYSGGTGLNNEQLGSDVLFFASDCMLIKFSPDGRQRVWATLLGGASNEHPASLIVNAQNELYIYGATLSANFPTANAYDASYNGNGDLFVARLSQDGTQLLGSTYVGGSGLDGVNQWQVIVGGTNYLNPLRRFVGDEARGEIILDQNGDVLVGATTRSQNFPTTAGVWGAAPGNSGADLRTSQDGVVFRLSKNLSTLMRSTYVPGNRNDAVYSLKTNRDNEIYLTGGTQSNTGLGIPATAWQATHANSNGADGYLLRLSADMSTVLGGTYIGTAAYDQALLVELDLDGKPYVVGNTEGAMTTQVAAGEDGIFSTLNGRQFFMRFAPNLRTRELSSVWGSGKTEPDISPTAFLVDDCYNIYVAGWGGGTLPNGENNISNMPVTADAVKPTTEGSDFYMLVLAQNGRSLVYGSYFGEANFAARDHVDGGTSRFDKRGKVYHAVCASCDGLDNFPTTPGAYSRVNGSTNCNNAVFKFDFQIINRAQPKLTARNLNTTGCAPFTFEFLADGTESLLPGFPDPSVFRWHFGDTTTGAINTGLGNPSVHVYENPGIFRVKLVAGYPPGIACSFPDSVEQEIIVYEVRNPGFEAENNPCELDVVLKNTTEVGVVYQWIFPDTVGALRGDTLVRRDKNSFVRTFRSSGVYPIKLVVNPGTVCSQTVESLVTVGLPERLDLGSRRDACSFTYALEAEDFNTSSWLWDFGDGNTSTQRNPTHTYAAPGTYTLTYTAFSTNGLCSVRFQQQFLVPRAPEVRFTIDSSSCLGEYNLIFQPNGDVATQYWVVNGDTVRNQVVDLNRYGPGRQEVELVARDKDQCGPTYRQTQTFYNSNFLELSIPNVFTPNGDGINDYWRAELVNPDCFGDVQVYNRWGEVVYEANVRGEGWDGRVGGEDAPEGVYVYILKIGKIEKVGTITLVR